MADMEPKRESTIKLRFGSQARNPSNEDVFKFFQKQNWSCEHLSAMYREDFSVLVRFQSESLMRKALKRLAPQTSFVYGDGTMIKVNVTAAPGSCKYLRVFGLPPDVEDERIAEKLSKHGIVHELIREQYPVETGFPIWNGIRGVWMEVVSDIPPQLEIHNIKAKICYEGLRNKCFECGATDHVKVNCPKRKNGKNKTGGTSYVDVVGEGVKSQELGTQPPTHQGFYLNA